MASEKNTERQAELDQQIDFFKALAGKNVEVEPPKTEGDVLDTFKGIVKQNEAAQQPEVQESSPLEKAKYAGELALTGAQGLVNQVPEMAAMPLQIDKMIEGDAPSTMQQVGAMGSALLSEKYPSQKENIAKTYAAILGFGDSARNVRDGVLDYVDDLPKSRVIPEGEDPIADAVYTGMNWLNPNLLAKGATKTDKLFDVGTGVAAAGGGYLAGEAGELAGGLGTTLADVLRSLRDKMPSDTLTKTAKQLYASIGRSGDAAKAENFEALVNAPENKGKELDELIKNPEIEKAAQVVARDTANARLANAKTKLELEKQEEAAAAAKDVETTLGVKNTGEGLSEGLKNNMDAVVESVTKKVETNLENKRMAELEKAPDEVQAIEDAQAQERSIVEGDINAQRAEALRGAAQKEQKSLTDAEAVAENVRAKSSGVKAQKQSEIEETGQFLDREISRSDADYVANIKALRATKTEKVGALADDVEAAYGAEDLVKAESSAAAEKAQEAKAKVTSEDDFATISESAAAKVTDFYTEETGKAKELYNKFTDSPEAATPITKANKSLSEKLNVIREGAKDNKVALEEFSKRYSGIYKYLEDPKAIIGEKPRSILAEVQNAKRAFRDQVTSATGAQMSDYLALDSLNALEKSLESVEGSGVFLKQAREAYKAAKTRVGTNGKVYSAFGKAFVKASERGKGRGQGVPAEFITPAMLKNQKGAGVADDLETLGLPEVTADVGEFLKREFTQTTNPEKFLKDHNTLLERTFPELKTEFEDAIASGAAAGTLRSDLNAAMKVSEAKSEAAKVGENAARVAAVEGRGAAKQEKTTAKTAAQTKAFEAKSKLEGDVSKADEELRAAEAKLTDEKQTIADTLKAEVDAADVKAKEARVKADVASAEKLAKNIEALKLQKTPASTARAKTTVSKVTELFNSDDSRKVIDTLISTPDNADNLNIIKAAAEEVGAGEEFKQLVGRTLADKLLTKDKGTGVDIVDTNSFSKMNETLTNLEKADIYTAGESKELIDRLRKSYKKLSETEKGIKVLEQQAKNAFNFGEEIMPAIGAWALLKGANINSLMLTGVVKRSLKHIMFDNKGVRDKEKIAALVDFVVEPKGLIPYFDKIKGDISQRQARRAADAYFSGVKISEFNSDKDNKDN